MNYHKLCKEILNNLNYTPKILLHSCCAPCSSQVITLLTEYFHITILYYNPNIYPKEEYVFPLQQFDIAVHLSTLYPKCKHASEIERNELINSPFKEN